MERRRKEREKEVDLDNRDRKKEMEEFEDIKRKILEEGASDAEEEIEKVYKAAPFEIHTPPVELKSVHTKALIT